MLACHHAKPVPVGPLPRAAYAHYLAGKLALYRDDAETAAGELKLAAQAAPDQPMIAVELARALAKARKTPEAQAVLAAAREKWPDHAQVWLASGELQEKTAPADAAKAYRRTIELARDDERGYVGLARVQLAQQDTKGAEATLRALVARIPGSVDGHYRLAQRLVLRGDLAGAAGELRAVLEHDPDHIDARLDLARTLRKLGKLDEAIAQTRSAFDRAGQPLDIAEELFGLLCEADDHQGAIDLLTLLDDDRSDADALAVIARLEISLGRIDEAAAIARHVEPADADVAATVAIAVALARHDLKAAHKHLAALPEGSPRLALARRLVAQGLLDAGDAAGALALAQQARLAAPDDAELALVTASALAELGRDRDATAVLDTLQTDATTLALIRARFFAERAPGRALELLGGVLRGHPDQLAALNLAGFILADQQQHLDVAERYLRHARELAPGDPAILDSWGWLLLRRGRTRDALHALDHAARYAPLEPEIAYHLAAAHAAAGDPRRASEILDHTRTLNPPPRLQRRIDTLRATLVIR